MINAVVSGITQHIARSEREGTTFILEDTNRSPYFTLKARSRLAITTQWIAGLKVGTPLHSIGPVEYYYIGRSLTAYEG